MLANLIQNCPGDGKHKVVVERCLYDWRSGTQGIPQGSMLGHWLLVIRLHDLHGNVGGEFVILLLQEI